MLPMIHLPRQKSTAVPKYHVAAQQCTGAARGIIARNFTPEVYVSWSEEGIPQKKFIPVGTV